MSAFSRRTFLGQLSAASLCTLGRSSYSSSTGNLFLGTQPDAAPDAPRERLLFDLYWRFHFGDPPDAGNIFDYPEREQLTKTWPNYLEEEVKLARSRINPVVNNLGDNISWVQPSFNDSN